MQKISASLAAVLLATPGAGGACGSSDPPPAPVNLQPAPTGPAEPFTPSYDCMPECFRKALEACQPSGACTLEGGQLVGKPETDGSSYESWLCFDNGVLTHSQSHWTGGVLFDRAEISQNGVACRVITSQAGPRGYRGEIKDSLGVIQATFAITGFPGMTLSCAGVDKVVDRGSDCGRTALALLSSTGLEPNVPLSCKIGKCR